MVNVPNKPYTQAEFDRVVAYLNAQEVQWLPQANWFEQAAIQRYLTPEVINHFTDGLLTAALTEPST